MQSVGWALDNSGVASPAQKARTAAVGQGSNAKATALPKNVRILKRHAFSSTLKRMSAIVCVENNNGEKHLRYILFGSL